jgi:hypothetical protein
MGSEVLLLAIVLRFSSLKVATINVLYLHGSDVAACLSARVLLLFIELVMM